MSYAVSNGAVGKSPLIDKLNRLPASQVKDMVSQQMDQLVCGHSKPVYPPVSASFSRCQAAVRQQLLSAAVKEGGKSWRHLKKTYYYLMRD